MFVLTKEQNILFRYSVHVHVCNKAKIASNLKTFKKNFYTPSWI